MIKYRQEVRQDGWVRHLLSYLKYLESFPIRRGGRRQGLRHSKQLNYLRFPWGINYYLKTVTFP